MASDYVRWRNIREFLDDLPMEHCQVKPGHEFCTVCLRINHRIAHDCPLFHQRPKKKRKVTPPPPESRPEPIKDHISASDVKQALKGEDFPIIEFAGPRGTGGHKEEEIFEVTPIDVKPMAAPPPETLKKTTKKAPKKVMREVTEEETEAADAKPATAVADRDPESIVQEIMDELEFPDEDLDEEDIPADKVDSEDDEVKEEEPEEEGPESAALDKEELDKEEHPVVKKEAVKKRRPKKK